MIKRYANHLLSQLVFIAIKKKYEERDSEIVAPKLSIRALEFLRFAFCFGFLFFGFKELIHWSYSQSV